MSLKSTRKRLKDYIELLRYGSDTTKKSSAISKQGKDPSSQVDMLKIIKDTEKKNKLKTLEAMAKRQADEEAKRREEEKKYNYIDRAKREREEYEAYNFEINEKSNNYRDRITFSDKKRNINNEEVGFREYYLKEKRDQKSAKIGKILIAAIVEVFTLIAIIGIGFFLRINRLKQTVEFNKSQVRNTNISETYLKTMEGYRTIAVFGLDSRTGSLGKGNNADVNIIVNIDLGTGDVKLVSIYRDLYLNINDNNGYGKINSAYMYGGPERAVKALNKNFDLDITNYASFNWKAVADTISLIGGIELEVSKQEYKYMNAFIHETCKATGIDSKNPAANYISGPGYQHLNGVQAVAYARLRLMDSDFQRVERQKKVIELCLQKAKTLSIDMLITIASNAAQTISFDVDWGELVSLINNIKNVNIVETANFPDLKHLEMQIMGTSGDCIVPKTLEQTVIDLHKFLYNDENYEPSKAVKSYSNRILELKNKYAEENRINESIKKEEEEKAKKAKTATGSTPKKKKKATKSVATSPADSLNDYDDYDEYEEYEEEPIEDETVENEEIDNENAPYSSGDNKVSPKITPAGSKTNTKNTNAPISKGPSDSQESNTPSLSGDIDISTNAPGELPNIADNENQKYDIKPVDVPTKVNSGNQDVTPIMPSGAPMGAPMGAPITSNDSLPPGPPIG